MNHFVPWLDRNRAYRANKPRLLPIVDALMAKSQHLQGGAVNDFEAAFARYLGVRHCVGVNSGMVALQLALSAVGVQPGDEVIASPVGPPWACLAIGALRAKPVFVDIEAGASCLDAARLEDAITSRTRAILPVHLSGQVADTRAIDAIAAERGIAVIEDASQALGATLSGRNAGTSGRIGCFRFSPSSNLGACGEAGALVTDDDEVAEDVRLWRDRQSYSLPMESFQAAVLAMKLRHLPASIAARRRVAERYTAGLSDIPAIEVPEESAEVQAAWQIYAVRTDHRDALRSYLAARGIQTAVHYPVPLHLQRGHANLGLQRGDFPVAVSLCDTHLSLPMFSELTDCEVDRVVDTIRSWAEIAPKSTSSRRYWSGQIASTRL
jgi:dTDP-4-amino-4,6-dideoxygalactose transaminase